MSQVKLQEWKPNRGQAKFLALPDTIKEGFYGGGAGSGKSEVLLMYGVCKRLHENPLFKQVFMRRTYPDLKKEITQRARELFTPFGAVFNKTDMVWTFPRPDQYGSGATPSGALIFLGHCELEKDVHQYDSMEISLFTPDELTNCTEYIYLYITQERNRSPKNSGLPSITRAAGMPGGVGHTFVKKRFVDLAPEGNKIIVGKGGNKRIYIHATLQDNLEHIDPTYAQSLSGRPEAERKAKLLGDWSAYQGLVFDEFRDKKYPDEPDNALHVIEPQFIPTWWPKFIVGDWGFAAMTYIGFYAVAPTGRVYLYRELSWLKTKISDWAPVVKSFVEVENPKTIKFCQSTKQDRGSDKTIQQQIEEHLGTAIELSVNTPGSRIAGKMLIHEYLRWKAKPQLTLKEQPEYNPEFALYIQRNRSIQEYKSYMDLFAPPKPEDNLPKLQIMCCEKSNHVGHPNCCPIMIDAIKAASYDKPKNEKPAEDVAEYDGDDPYDALRYALDTVENYVSESSNEFERLKKEEQMVALLRNTNDWTGFYRNMNKIESESTVPVVHRYSGRKH